MLYRASRPSAHLRRLLLFYILWHLHIYLYVMYGFNRTSRTFSLITHSNLECFLFMPSFLVKSLSHLNNHIFSSLYKYVIIVQLFNPIKQADCITFLCLQVWELCAYHSVLLKVTVVFAKSTNMIKADCSHYAITCKSVFMIVVLLWGTWQLLCRRLKQNTS